MSYIIDIMFAHQHRLSAQPRRDVSSSRIWSISCQSIC